MIGEFLAVLFLSRDIAHREHLRTKSYAQHKGLESFYEDIIDAADALAEACQGRHGLIEEIPLLDIETAGAIDEVLESHMRMVEKMRYKALSKDDSPLQSLVDDLVVKYLRTLYKLRMLK